MLLMLLVGFVLAFVESEKQEIVAKVLFVKDVNNNKYIISPPLSKEIHTVVQLDVIQRNKDVVHVTVLPLFENTAEVSKVGNVLKYIKDNYPNIYKTSIKFSVHSDNASVSRRQDDIALIVLADPVNYENKDGIADAHHLNASLLHTTEENTPISENNTEKSKMFIVFNTTGDYTKDLRSDDSFTPFMAKNDEVAVYVDKTIRSKSDISTQGLNDAFINKLSYIRNAQGSIPNTTMSAKSANNSLKMSVPLHSINDLSSDKNNNTKSVEILDTKLRSLNANDSVIAVDIEDIHFLNRTTDSSKADLNFKEHKYGENKNSIPLSEIFYSID